MLATWVVARDIPVRTWAATVWWSPTRGHGLTTPSEPNPLPFIALSPCEPVPPTPRGRGRLDCLDRIVVRGPKDLEFFYTVSGVRKGYGAVEPMSQGSEFVSQSPSPRLPEGLSPETKRRLLANGTHSTDVIVKHGNRAAVGVDENLCCKGFSRRVEVTPVARERPCTEGREVLSPSILHVPIGSRPEPVRCLGRSSV
jgi:hypothetical protein